MPDSAKEISLRKETTGNSSVRDEKKESNSWGLDGRKKRSGTDSVCRDTAINLRVLGNLRLGVGTYGI